MTPRTITEKAIRGGWKPEAFKNSKAIPTIGTLAIAIKAHLLDPKFWEAAGKSMGWDNKTVCDNVYRGIPCCSHQKCGKCGKGYVKVNQPEVRHYWRGKMHDMIDALAEGKTIEEYLKTL